MASKQLSESNPTDSFNNIKTKMQEFNTVLQSRKYDHDTLPVVPYFLYVITQNEKGELISMALGDDMSKYDNDDPIQPVVITSSSSDDTSIANVINRHISDPLKNLYKQSLEGDDNSFVSDEFSEDQSSKQSLGSMSDVTDKGAFGGSRSRKHRRRHKQKKNKTKNTKRRTRK